MRQLVFDSAQDGVGPTVVHRILDKEGYPTSYQTVLGWMKEDAAVGVLSQPGGDRTRTSPARRRTRQPRNFKTINRQMYGRASFELLLAV
jgi:hypothetical protein